MTQERVAVTVWGGRVSPVLDVSTRALVLTIEDGEVRERSELELPEPGAAKLAALSGRGVQTLLCGAVSGEVAQEAPAFGVRLVSFVAGAIDEIVAAYLAGRLPHPALAMPGCRGRRLGGGSHRCRRGRWAVGDEGVMPERDGTGPRGGGPGTSPGQGPCPAGRAAGDARPRGGRGRSPHGGHRGEQDKGPGRGPGSQH